MTTNIRRITSALLLLLITTVAAQAAERAGRVTFAFGGATATAPDGAKRVLRRGGPVFSGERLDTGNGRLQVRFRDGGFVSLIPRTTFKIDEFRFKDKADGSERGFFSLLKGGLRALSGLIGKKNRAAYQMRTPVATIGIRGTWYRALLDRLGRLLVSVGFDPINPSAVVLTNSAGQLVIKQGQNGKVDSPDSAPTLTNEQALLAAAQPGDTSTEPVFTSGDERNADGGNAIVEEPAVQVITGLSGADFSPPDPPFDPQGDVAIAEQVTLVTNASGQYIAVLGKDKDFPGTTFLGGTDPDGIRSVQDPATKATVDEFLANADPSVIDQVKQNPAKVLEAGSVGDIRWFRWGQGRIFNVERDANGNFMTDFDEFTGNVSAHVITGPTATAMPNVGIGVYTFIADSGTDSTSAGGTIGNGITGGQLVVNFDPMPFVGVSLTVQHNPTYTVSGSVDIKDTFFSTDFGGAVVAQTNTAGSACNPSCNGVELDGFFSGTTPAGSAPPDAGVSLLIPDNDPVGATGAFTLGNYDPNPQF